MNRKERTIALVLLSGLLVGAWLPERLIVATSDSLDHRVFFKVPVDRQRIELGDYLLFGLDDSREATFIRKGLRDNKVLIKKVGCVPGEILTKDAENTFYCRKTKLGTALDQDSQGNKLPVFKLTGPIPQDSYYMMGTNPRSFDSRYFGLIHGNDFIHKAIPIW